MRLTQNKIEEIIGSILGEESRPLVKQLYARENISEFDLATKTKKDIKIIRKMLYILYNNNLVGFTRKKDKIKGWYVYYWTLIPESVRYHYIKKKKEQLVMLQQRLEEEKKEIYFSCPNKCVRLNLDQAMNFEFHCPECGELTQQENSETKQSELVQRIKLLAQELAETQEIRKVVKTKIKANAKARKKVVKARVKKMKAKKKNKKR